MSHANPGRDVTMVVERGIDLLLAECEKKKLGRAKRPRQPSKGKRGTIGRATRRERCTFESEDGLRCEAKAFLELDHVDPRARGGSGESSNVRVLCRAHNRLVAEREFGKEYVSERIHLRQRAGESERAEACRGSPNKTFVGSAS